MTGSDGQQEREATRAELWNRLRELGTTHNVDTGRRIPRKATRAELAEAVAASEALDRQARS